MPALTQQPVSVSVVSGQPATFTVAATGTGTVSYQWRRLGQPIAGADGNTLALPVAKLVDAGFYDVEVKDDQGSTLSEAAQLSMAAPQAAPIYRMDPTYSVCLARTGEAEVRAIAVAGDGAAIVGGSFAIFAGKPRAALARLTPSMELDPGFQPTLLDQYGNVAQVETLLLQADGKILVGGSFVTVNGETRRGLARLNADGSLDPSFDFARFYRYASVTHLLRQPDGCVLVVGNLGHESYEMKQTVIRLLPTGELDSDFNVSPTAHGAMKVALAADGRIYATGLMRWITQSDQAKVVRLNHDGSLDESFAPVVEPAWVSALVVLADGRLLVGGHAIGENIWRYRSDGTLDPDFSPSGDISVYSVSLLLQSDGRILVGRYFPDGSRGKPTLIRINTDGTQDPTYALTAAPDESVQTLLAHPAGGFLAGGRFVHVGEAQVAGFARLSDAGGLLAYAAGPCGSAGTVSHALLLPDNRVLVVGSFTFVGNTPRTGAAIIGPDGAADPGFDPGSGFGRPSVEFFCTELMRDAAGRFLVRGTFGTYGGQACTDFVRILPDGKPDSTFVPGLPWGSRVTGMMLGPRGELYVATRRGAPDICRLLDTGAVDPTFVRPNVFRLTVAGLHAAQADGRLIATIPDVGLQRLNTDGSIDPTFDTSALSPQGVPWNRLGELELLADGAFLTNNAWTSVSRCRAQLSVERPSAASSLVDVCDLGEISFPSSAPMQILPLDDGRLLIAGKLGRRGATRSIGLAIVKPESVSPAPVILHQPANLVVREGQAAALSITMGGEGPFDYLWMKGGNIAAQGSSNALSFPAALLSDSGTYSVTVTSDFGTVMSDQARLTVHNEDFVSFSDWAANGFTEAELADPAISAPDVDPEHCGLSNLLRYAFKYPAHGPVVGSPTQATTAILYGSEKYLAVSFRRKTYAPDIRYVIEGTDDLHGTWTYIDEYLPGLPELVVAPDNIPMAWTGVSRRFLRVRVEHVP